MKRVAIVFQNVIQWYALRPLVKLLSEKKIPVDILIYNPAQANDDYHSIAEDTIKTIKKDGFNVKDWPTNKEYHLGLAPYSDMISFKCKYRLGYCYGAVTTKPHFTLQPAHKMNFHGMMVHDTYTAELFSVYGRTYIVPYLYLESIKHRKISDKPVVLYLPTYNEPSVPLTAAALSELKNDYYIITKGHHGTDHLQEEQSKKNILKEIADENYDSNQYIKPLFEKADVVLSDNSGATVDALYAKIPVVIATKAISPSFNGIEAVQQSLIDDGVIPYVSNINASNLKATINRALTKKQQDIQATASDKLFPIKTGGAEAWYKIIKLYIDEEIDQNYCKLHDYYISEWQKLKSDNLQIKPLQNEILALKTELDFYKKSRAHQAIDKVLSKRHQKQNKN